MIVEAMNKMEMKVLTAAISDVGTRKSVNQDAVMLKVAKTEAGENLILAVLCDGLGGLSCGEAASAAFVSEMEAWFVNRLPVILSGEVGTQDLSGMSVKDDFRKAIRRSWEYLADDMNERIGAYGRRGGFQLGTTALCLIIKDRDFLLMNVGDSRLYKVTDTAEGIRQLTHDHSLVQQQIDRGEITYEEAEQSANKSVLLQCVGASERVYPDFFYGNITRDTSYLLCSDGFWRRLSLEELERGIKPSVCIDEARLSQNLTDMTECVKRRGEEDNISAVLITCRVE